MTYSMLKVYLSMLERYASAISFPEHRGGVFSNSKKFLNENSLGKRFFRRLKRDIVMVITLQSFLIRSRIPKKARKVLYVYLGTPNLGDSIMDLSPRLLWGNASLQVDMYTNEEIANFYKGDSSFTRIICSPLDLESKYDFIILQSYSWKCLKFKWRYFPCDEYTSLYGHYYGCEFNRLAFAECAWRNLLDLPADDGMPLRPIFNLSFAKPERHSFAGLRIAVAIGGIVDWRTYSLWQDVILLMDKHMPDVTWILLGSANGVCDAQSLVLIEGLRGKVVNYVNKLSLQDVVLELNSADMLLAADGGLLNIGRTTGTPTVGLFARDIHPLMRFDSCDRAYAIHALKSVNEIPPQLICEAAIELLDGLSESLIVKYLAEEPDCNLC